jgi:hypothetical protein
MNSPVQEGRPQTITPDYAEPAAGITALASTLTGQLGIIQGSA